MPSGGAIRYDSGQRVGTADTHTRWCRRLVVLAIAGVITPACSSGSPAEPVARRDAVFESVDPLGFHAVLGTAPGEFTVHVAMSEVRRDCMAERGFTGSFEIGDARVTESRVAAEQNLLFGLSSTSDATSIGLASTAAAYDAEVDAEQARSDQLVRDLAARGPDYTEAWYAAYLGAGEPLLVPVGRGGSMMLAADGCLAESYRAVFGDIGAGVANELLFGQLRGELFEAAYASPAVRAALDEWRACIESHGYSYDDPLHVYRTAEAAFDRSSEEYAGDQRAAAFEVAVTAMLKECDSVSGLYEVGWAEVPVLVDRLVADHAAKIALYRAAVERAADLLR